MLPLAIPQHVQILQGMQHIIRRHGAERADLLYGYLAAAFAILAVLFVLDEHVGDGFGPVGAVAEEAEVGERFLGRAELALAFGELVAEGYDEFAEAVALVLGEGEDAGYVVAFGGLFFFAEVADQMAPVGVASGHAVEKKWIDVIVEGFVV